MKAETQEEKEELEPVRVQIFDGEAFEDEGFDENSEEEKEELSEQLLKLTAEKWKDRLDIKMEKLTNAGRHDFKVKGRLLIYASKDNISENINGQVSIDDQEFWCRHWARLRLQRNGDYREYLNNPLLFEDDMREMLRLEFEGKLYDADQYHLVDIRHFGHALAQRCQNLTLGDEEHIQFCSGSHMMSILIKHKVDKTTGDYKGIALEFYDPNETFKHIRVLAPDADALEEFELKDWLEEGLIYDYFPYRFQCEERLQQKAGLFHVDVKSSKTITEKVIVDDSLEIDEILLSVFHQPMGGKMIPGLIKKGMAVNYADSTGRTPLFVSSCDGCVEDIKLLIGLGARVNRATHDGITPLYVAAQSGHVEAIQFLIEKGANVNKASNSGCTPLARGVLSGHVEAVRVLIGHGADVNQVHNHNGHTPIFIAVHKGHMEAMKLLIDKDADVNQADNDGYTPLFIAAENGHVKAIQLLIDYRADVNKADNNGYTPLFIAAENGHVKAMRLLIDYRADVHQAGNDGYTPLHIAVDNGHVEAMRLLIQHRADVNKADNDGYTPLLVAMECKNIEIVKLLIDAGATIDLSKATEEQLLQLDEWDQQGEIDLSRLKDNLKSVYEDQVKKRSSGKGASNTFTLFKSEENAGLATSIKKLKGRSKIGLFNRASEATLQYLTETPMAVYPSHKSEGDSDTDDESKTTEDGRLVYEPPTDEKRVLERVDDVHPMHNAL